MSKKTANADEIRTTVLSEIADLLKMHMVSVIETVDSMSEKKGSVGFTVALDRSESGETRIKTTMGYAKKTSDKLEDVVDDLDVDKDPEQVKLTPIDEKAKGRKKPKRKETA